MKKLLVLSMALWTMGCSKTDLVTVKEPEPDFEKFTEYTILQGQHQSNHGYDYLKQDTLAFTVNFSQSCRYTTVDPLNQIDVNKLYGFCDNDGEHHQFSARFGWNFVNDRLQLHGYIYNQGLRSSRFITSVPFETNVRCGIVAQGNKYIFKVGNDTIQMPRLAQTPKATGYKLYPYFGGDETAPHTMKILIRDDKTLL